MCLSPIQSEYVSVSVTSRKAANNRQRATIGVLATLLLLITGAGTLAFLAQRNEAAARQFAQEQQRRAELGQQTAEQARTRAEIARQEAEEQRQFAQTKQQEAEAAQRQRAEVGEVAAQRQAAIAKEQTAIAQHQTAVAATARQRSESEALNANLLARSLTTDNLLLSDFNLEALLNGLDGSVKLWRRQGTLLKTLTGNGDDEYITVNFSPDGNVLAASDASGTIYLWAPDGVVTQTRWPSRAPRAALLTAG